MWFHSSTFPGCTVQTPEGLLLQLCSLCRGKAWPCVRNSQSSKLLTYSEVLLRYLVNIFPFFKYTTWEVIAQLGAQNPSLSVTVFNTYMTVITTRKKREVLIAVWYWVCATARKHLDVYKWRRVENHWLRWFVFKVRISLILKHFCVFVDLANFLENMRLMMAFCSFLPGLFVGISLWVKIIF